MNRKLDKSLQQWLTQISDQWTLPIEELKNDIDAGEINNRLQFYPKLRPVLSSTPFNIDEFNKVSRGCWALGSQADRIRLNYFTQRGQLAEKAVLELVNGFPEDDQAALKRIDQFISKAVKLGYSTPSGSADWAGAALLASVILTVLYPQRFVDFRQTRWLNLAKTLDYPPPGEKGYGAGLIWAGKFATEIANTKTFQQYWPEGESLWIIAGICWVGPSPTKPETDPVDVEERESFPEGREKRRLHLIRERSVAVVLKVKQLGLEQDPMLRCQVCGFSFAERYGELGQGFIEAHHTRPVATLKPDSRTGVKDIALLCANCHRMIHRGDHTLTLQELQDRLKD